ncbi:MAG: hypothetical protein ACTSQY_05555 [Candidatus Odinarchaeia archaeon]
MSCVICEAPTSKKPFCDKHMSAEKSLRDAFKSWKKAKNIDWDQYLDEIIENSNTGKWVREVAEYLKKQK